MNEVGYITIILLSILTGMLMAFGLVLVFAFYGPDDTTCYQALYGLIAFLK